METSQKHQKNIYTFFIDYKKACDCADPDQLWRDLEGLGLLTHLDKLLQSLYTNREATAWTPYGDPDWFKIEKGVC